MHLFILCGWIPALCSRAKRFSISLGLVSMVYASITEVNRYVNRGYGRQTSMYFFFKRKVRTVWVREAQPFDAFQACRPHGWSHAGGTGKPRPNAIFCRPFNRTNWNGVLQIWPLKPASFRIKPKLYAEPRAEARWAPMAMATNLRGV